METNGGGYLHTITELVSGKEVRKPASIAWQRINKASDPKSILIVLVSSSVYTVYMVKWLGVEVIGVRVGEGRPDMYVNNFPTV